MSGNQLQILLVEDSVGDALSFCRAASRVAVGVAVKHVPTAEAALFLLERSSADDYGFCLFDINLPKLSGLELLRCVKVWHPALPIMMMSNSDSSNDIDRAFILGADGYIVKPFDFHVYNDIVRCLCDCWLDGKEMVSGYAGIILCGGTGGGGGAPGLACEALRQ